MSVLQIRTTYHQFLANAAKSEVTDACNSDFYEDILLCIYI